LLRLLFAHVSYPNRRSGSPIRRPNQPSFVQKFPIHGTDQAAGKSSNRTESELNVDRPKLTVHFYCTKYPSSTFSSFALMPCTCSAGLCSNCACGKGGRLCIPACHGPGNSACMNTAEGKKVSALPLAEVRKTLAAAGLDVIGNQPELRRRMVDHLIALSAASTPGAVAATNDTSPNSNAALIKAAQACGDDYAALLSLAGEPVSVSSPAAVLRRSFLKLSVRLHPDKNVGVPGAAIAFQALVLAFERLSQGAEAATADTSTQSSQPRARMDTTVVRSNTGCVQTRIYCPRCRMDWPRKELGLEDAAYNFLMVRW
jgi:hypothetical protein